MKREWRNNDEQNNEKNASELMSSKGSGEKTATVEE